MKISELLINPKNPRLITEVQLKKLMQSISDFPKMMKLRPIIYDPENMYVLGGNMRLRVLQELGYKEIPDEWARPADELTEDEKRRFIIEDNLQFGEFEWDMLREDWDFDELEQWGMDMSGFKDNEVTEDDYVVPDHIETDIVLGDLFHIGEHRLMCGDSKNESHVKKLLDGQNPTLMVTDPPYGVDYDPEWRRRAGVNKSQRMEKVENDDNPSWFDAYRLFGGDIAYVWHAGLYAHVVVNDLIECGFVLASQIIWAKSQLVFSRGDYHWKHEPCLYAVRKGKKHNWKGGRDQTTLWEIAGMTAVGKSDIEDEFNTHSTQKPVECMARPMRNHIGKLIYDPFIGSGTTMVAAEQLKRICFGMDLKPVCCQMVIDRMKKLDPEIEIKKIGNFS